MHREGLKGKLHTPDVRRRSENPQQTRDIEWPWPNVWSMLCQRSRRCPNKNNPTSVAHLMFPGLGQIQSRVQSIDTEKWYRSAKTGCWSNVVFMLGQRRRRWINIKTTLVHCVVFAGTHIQWTNSSLLLADHNRFSRRLTEVFFLEGGGD